MAQLPAWQALDAGVAVPDGATAGRIVALVASEGAVEEGWAGTAALDLARAWSEAGQKVILVDGALHYPALHVAAEIENVEGLSDAALFGVSVGRVAKPVDGFFLITAGTAVADANAVASSPRWSVLLGGFREAGVTLLLFVRDGDSGCAAFLGSASDVVVLAGPNEKIPAAVRDVEELVRAVTGPAPAQGAGSGARPPAEWTAAGPDGRRRVKILALVLVAVALVLLFLFGVLPVLGLSPEPAGTVSQLTTGSASISG